jgi:hypothetical protein
LERGEDQRGAAACGRLGRMAMRESSAFREAALRSEVVRAWLVIGIGLAVVRRK